MTRPRFPGLARHAKAAIMLDAGTGAVLFEKNAHRPLSPASTTKMLTALIVMEQIENGTLCPTDPVEVSARAASIRGSTLHLQCGDTVSVEDLLKGALVASANDACYALAEHVAGSVEAFVQRMAEKIKQLGLAHTNFVNPNGSPARNHRSTAHDLAIMSRELLRKEGITSYTGVKSVWIQKSGVPCQIRNTNKLIGIYPGLDGLKTGYTKYAGFCLAASACRKNQRIIAVIMGEPTRRHRDREMSALLTYGFARMKEPLP